MHHPMDYARVVKKIGNEMDMTLIDLEDILPQVCPVRTIPSVRLREPRLCS